MILILVLLTFSFRSGSPQGVDPRTESPCPVRAAYRNPRCQRTSNSPLCTHEDWGKTNAIAPFNTGPVPLLDGTKQHGEPTRLPSDPRSREDTANGVGCLIQNGQNAASVSRSDPSPESTGKEQPAHADIRSRPRKTNLHGHIKRTTFTAKKAKNSFAMILNHRRYLYIQAHSMEENSTERHFVVTCLLFCLPCWMDIAVL